MQRTTSAIVGLVLVVVLFFALNIAAAGLLRSMRLDLTENRIHTLSQGSRRIAATTEDRINLYYYFSEDVASGQPAIKQYGNRVRELLEEYERASNGRITLEVIEPEPFSDDEDRAVADGVQPSQMADGRLFMGLVATNDIDDKVVIPFFNPQQERFLEYEITRTIYTLSNPDRPVVGVMSPLPLDGVRLNPQTMQPQQGEPWYILQEIGSLFEVQSLDVGIDTIPDDVDILLLVHPKDFADVTVYAIDQFVMRGGRLALFVDPHCFADQTGQFRDQMEALLAPRWSNVPRLLSAWGLTMDHELVVGDLANALEVPIAGQRGTRDSVTYPPAMALRRDQFNDDDPITAGLSSVSFFNPGELVMLEGATTTITRLVETSSDSALVSVDDVRFGPNASVLAEFVASDEHRMLGARVTGPASSAFDTPPEGAVGEHVASADDINVVVFSDVDMLQNSMWLQTLFAGMYRRVADNGSLLVNALENLSGSSDLISLRARGSFQRPFERIDDLRRQAEQNFRAEEERLNTRLGEIEREIQEIQSARPDASELTGVLLTPEQQQKLDDAREEQRTTRKAIRDLRLDLDRTIEDIQTKLKFVNMGLIPIVVALVAVVLGLYRTQRRRLDRKTLAGG